jgi:hypothetical protein
LKGWIGEETYCESVAVGGHDDVDEFLQPIVKEELVDKLFLLHKADLQ